MRIKVLVLFSLLLLIIVGCSEADPGESLSTESETEIEPALVVGINEGDIAPDFELVAMDGSTHRLSDYRGRVVLLNFWATWCPYCRAEMPDFEHMYTESYSEEEFVILAVDFGENKETVQAYLDSIDHNISFPILLDDTKAIYREYNKTNGTPQSYIIDKDGVIRKFISGQWKLSYNSYLCELGICREGSG